MSPERTERTQLSSINLYEEIENFKQSIITLETELASHIRGLNLMSNQLDKIIDNLMGHEPQSSHYGLEIKNSEGMPRPKYSVEGFEKRVQEVMAELNRDAIALRYLREEAMQIRENCLA